MSFLSTLAIAARAMLCSLFIAGMSFSLFGCVGSTVDRLPAETRFREIQSPADLEGVFQNQGSSPTGDWRPYLSDLIFPGYEFSDKPDQIRFRFEEPSSLKSEAILKGQTIKERKFVEGQDFQLVEGRLRLGRKLGESGILEGGLGVSTEVSFISLTEDGDVVWSYNISGIGLMLFILPLAMNNFEEAIFPKMTEERQDIHPINTDLSDNPGIP